MYHIVRNKENTELFKQLKVIILSVGGDLFVKDAGLFGIFIDLKSLKLL